MTRYGYFLSSEEYEPASLIRQATMAEQAGFDAGTASTADIRKQEFAFRQHRSSA
jgi:hypothetical protein